MRGALRQFLAEPSTRLPVVALYIRVNKFQAANINEVIAKILYAIYFWFTKIQPDKEKVKTKSKVDNRESKKD